MKCQYCGKELAPGSKFCDGCGAKTEMVQDNVMPNNGGYVQPNQAQPMYQQYNNQNKGSNGLKILIIVLIIIILLGVGFGVWYFVLRSDDSDKKENNEISLKDDNTTGGNTKDDGNTGGNTGGNSTSGSHILNCSLSEDGTSVNVNVYFNSDETEPKRYDLTMTMSVEEFEGVDQDQLKQLFEQQLCEGSGYDSCNVTISGTSASVTISSSSFDDDDEFISSGSSLEDVKKNAESEGYTCTKR